MEIHKLVAASRWVGLGVHPSPSLNMGWPKESYARKDPHRLITASSCHFESLTDAHVHGTVCIRNSDTRHVRFHMPWT